MRMIVRGARLLHTSGLSDIEVAEDGRIARVIPYDDQKEPRAPASSSRPTATCSPPPSSSRTSTSTRR
ncbi:hypothetical protein WKI68_21285 [Streptomyces sp. MS1.HAVA.3]|uniref:Uncharacterized protein n=1 Tax=Streptomyces caledonius TaxID=3134107 RepID=A0ABU8U7V8_9ACTN